MSLKIPSKREVVDESNRVEETYFSVGLTFILR